MAKHDRESLFRYLARDLTDAERSEVERHIKDCRECSDFLSFAGGLKTALKETASGELGSGTSCPDAETLAAFSAGQLDDKNAQLVRKHAVFCTDCLEELALLRQATESAGIRFAETAWSELVEQLKAFVIDLGKIYGPGSLIGPVRIVAEAPAFAMRSGQRSRVASKVLEISVGENTYSIELALTDDDSVSCDIAGSRTPLQVPLNVSVRSGTSEELFSVESDGFGNARFVIPPPHDDFLLLVLNLKGITQEILFRVTEGRRTT